MEKKKILIDARCIGGEGQGMMTYIVGLYNEMFYNFGNRYEFYFAGYNYKEFRANFPWLKQSNFIQIRTSSKWSLFTKVFPKIIKDYKIEYAHFQYVTPFIKKCKQIVTTHDVLFLDFPEEFSLAYRLKRKFLFKLSLLRSEIRLTVSNYSRNKIADHFSLMPSTISITPNAVNENFLKSYDKSLAQKEVEQIFGIKKYILYVSRIEQRKNQLGLLKAYEKLNLATKGYQLLLIGNDTLGEKSISKEILQFQKTYPNQVHWLKNLTEEDLIKIYQGAEIFVYPSKAEGFGIPPIEAAALGINTLCASNTAMQDFSFFGSNLYNDSKIENLHSVLDKNLQQPPSPIKLKSISNQIKEHYSWLKAAQVLDGEIMKAQ